MEMGGKPPPRHLFLEGTETNMLGFEPGAGRFSLPVSLENKMADPYDVCYSSVQCSCGKAWRVYFEASKDTADQTPLLPGCFY